MSSTRRATCPSPLHRHRFFVEVPPLLVGGRPPAGNRPCSRRSKPTRGITRRGSVRMRSAPKPRLKQKQGFEHDRSLIDPAAGFAAAFTIAYSPLTL